MYSKMLDQTMDKITSVVVDFDFWGIVKINYDNGQYQKISSYEDFNGEELNFIYENKLLKYKRNNIIQ